MIKKLSMFRQRVITFTLLLTMLSTSSWTGIATAQTTGNAQTSASPEKEIIHYSEAKALPDGGINYVFNIDGVHNILHEPPDGFSAVTATDAQLAEYGIPPRPKDEKGLTKWKNTWGRFKHKRSSSEPFLIVVREKKEPVKITTTTGIKPNTINSNTVNTLPQPSNEWTSPNWSGYICDTPGNITAYNSVAGEFTQPRYYSSPYGAQETSWVGFGGYNIISNNNTKALIQVGTDINQDNSYAFYEWYCNFLNTNTYEDHKTIVGSVSINPGDDISVSVTWSNSSYPAGFTLTNWTNWNHFYITAQVPPYFYDGSTADFIEERPGNPDLPLANYYSVPWVGCEANSTDFTTHVFDKLIMTNDKNETLSMPFLNSSNSFTDIFYQSQ